MFWTLCLGALAVHMLCATLMMRHHARAVIGWRIGLIKGLYGQFAITLFGILFAGGVLLIMDGIGLRQGTGFYLLIGFMFLIGWGIGQMQLTEWMSQRAKDLYLSQARARRITSATVLYVVAFYALLGACGFFVWNQFLREGAEIARDGDTARPPAAAAPPAPVVAPAPAPSPAPAAKQAAKPAGEAAVLEAVNAWAQAWSKRDVDAYVGSYAADFRPAEGLTRAQWLAQRRERIAGAANIAVVLEALNTTLEGTDRATVRFRQIYKSERMTESTPKTLRLRLDAGAWKIVEEKTGA